MATDKNAESRTISGEKVDSVNATSVTITQSAVQQITAERVALSQASAKKIEARSAQIEQGSVFKLKAENAVLNRSAATFVDANEARLVNVNAILVRGTTNAVEGDLKTVLHVGEATGNVHAIFDKESAVRFGAALGAALVVLSVLARKLFR